MSQTAELEALLLNPDNRIVVHLAKNTIALDADTIALADFTECDFPGYEAVENPGWGPVADQGDDYAEAVSDPCRFDVEVNFAGQTVTAVYVTLAVAGGAAVLLAPFPLAEPVLLTDEGEFFERQIRISSVATP